MSSHSNATSQSDALAHEPLQEVQCFLVLEKSFVSAVVTSAKQNAVSLDRRGLDQIRYATLVELDASSQATYITQPPDSCQCGGPVHVEAPKLAQVAAPQDRNPSDLVQFEFIACLLASSSAGEFGAAPFNHSLGGDLLIRPLPTCRQLHCFFCWLEHCCKCLL